MNLEDPIAAYNAEGNMEAILVQQYLQSHGIPAFAVEDNSLVGHWWLGNLPEIHKPQVWIEKADSERVAALLATYEEEKLARRKAQLDAPDVTIDVQCEDCKTVTPFSIALSGTVQSCPKCRAFLDVGEFEWPSDEDFGQSDSTQN